MTKANKKRTGRAISNQQKKTDPAKEARTADIRQAKAAVKPQESATKLSDVQMTSKFVDEIEGKFHNLISLAKKTVDQTNLQTDLALKELKKTMDQAQSWVSEHHVGLGDISARASEMIDTAKVKAHLAKMDATDLAEPVLARLDRMQAEMRGLNSTVSADLSQMFQRFKQTFNSETRAT